ncbi:MAG: DUF3347 domain-containing protein [Vicingaceae bacterium]|nr:DUF3347 domain-containing protein [Flavobacteriales bacterium]MDF1674682.1 DUF3347 domain-containing protein [Vicingaceae bacterium]
MKTTTLIFTGITITALITLGACGNNKNEHEDHSHEHHENMEAEKGHDHSLMEGSHAEMEQKEDMHKEHEAIQDKFAHQDIIILNIPYQVEEAEKENFQQVVAAYIDMKNEFVADNLEGVDNAIAIMKEKVNKVSGQLLKNEGDRTWKQHAELYNSKLDEMAHIEGLEAKRSYFGHISEVFYCTIKSFDFSNNQELYATFCPMAFDGKGAYWVSETKEIKNPYFGKKMLKCGSVKEEL